MTTVPLMALITARSSRHDSQQERYVCRYNARALFLEWLGFIVPNRAECGGKREKQAINGEIQALQPAG